MRVICHLVSVRHILGKYCPDDGEIIFNRIFIKLADNGDRNKILDKIHLSMIWNTGMIVTCP